MIGRIENLLVPWLPQQRWFAGKGQEIDEVSVLADTELVTGDPALHHLIVGVRQGSDVTPYQLLVGLRRRPAGRLEYAEIGTIGEYHAYDAVHDPELTRVLLTGMASATHAGTLSFHHVPGVEIDTELHSLASPAEQSNTSLIFGDAYICKLFRRISPGVNPDLEVSLRLAGRDEHIVPLYGWAEMPLAGEPTTLAVMSKFLRTGTDGWRLATASVRDLYAEADLHADEVGGDFASESERLGAATARVHADLADAFGIGELSAAEVHDLIEGMRVRLAEACLAVRGLRPYADGLRRAFDEAAKLDQPMRVQRVHGDYHLGQVMRVETGWVLLDFEGEPAKPLAERIAPAHPLRDVAGMMRSFEYAAGHLLVNGGRVIAGDTAQLEYRAREWADRNREAFCRGYAEAGGTDPDAHAVMLRALEFDKAVYEVVYEARNRPTWLPIPLGSLAHLADTSTTT